MRPEMTRRYANDVPVCIFVDAALCAPDAAEGEFRTLKPLPSLLVCGGQSTAAGIDGLPTCLLKPRLLPAAERAGDQP
jgi:hypothetical protein